MDHYDYSYCVRHGMDPSIRFPASINDYHRGVLVRDNLPISIQTIQAAMDKADRDTYGNPLRSYAIDPEDPSEVDDCVSRGREDASYSGAPGAFPVLYVSVPDTVFMTNSLPPIIRHVTLAAGEKHGTSRYMKNYTFPMWPKELINHSVLGFPKMRSKFPPAIFRGKDGTHRVPCVTFVIPYNKDTGVVNFDKAKIRFTTIRPPLQYTYNEADDVLINGTRKGNLYDEELKELLEDVTKIADANDWYDPYGDLRDTSWLVSICMNMANITAARHIKKHGLPAIYRHQYQSDINAQNSLSLGNPVRPLNDVSSPRFEEFGYVRVTSPARRLEDHVNLYILYCAIVLKCKPIDEESLNKLLQVVRNASNEEYSKKHYK